MKKKGFGLYGWIIIIIGLFACFGAGLLSTSLNVVNPRFCELYGWSKSDIPTAVTYIGLINSVLSLIFSFLVSKNVSGKLLAVFSFSIGAAGLALLGTATTLVQFSIYYLMFNVGINGIACYALPVLIGNWFPRKKGIVVGIVTVGQNISTMSVAWMFTGLWEIVDFKLSFVIFSLFLIIPLLLLIFLIKDKPEYQGCFPDNDSSVSVENIRDRKKREKIIEKTNPFTFGKLLKTKQLWLLIIGNGLLQMMLMGFIGNVVPASMSFGNEQTYAMGLLTWGSLIAIPSSIFLGWIDTKFGTRIASIIVGISGVLSMVISLFHGSLWVAVIGCITFGFFSGTSNNLVNSLLISIFGRYDFKKALAITQPVLGVLRALGSAVVALSIKLTDTYDLGLIIFAVLTTAATIIFFFLKDKCIGRTEKDIEKAIKEYEEAEKKSF